MSTKTTYNFEPFGSRILLESAKSSEMEDGGIILPSSEKKTRNLLVLTVGPDVKHVKPGFRVLIGQYAGHEITVGDANYTLVNEDEVLGRVR